MTIRIRKSTGHVFRDLVRATFGKFSADTLIEMLGRTGVEATITTRQRRRVALRSPTVPSSAPSISSSSMASGMGARARRFVHHRSRGGPIVRASNDL